MKLNKRLLVLSEMVTKPYQLVWDCCCDHGLLGIKILSDGLVKQVNFVDLVPEIITNLDNKLSRFGHKLPVDCQWQTFCQDVALLSLDNALEKSHADTKELVIISGVGGELMLSMLSRLMESYSGKNIDFLLCPVNHTYQLREGLIKLNFKLIEERLVTDNDRGYELLLVNQTAQQPLSLLGECLWVNESESQLYLQKLIQHYQRRESDQTSTDCVNYAVLTAYQNLYQSRYA